jgi:hypothetical protein
MALTAGCEKIEAAAEAVARMNMKDPEAAVRHCRSLTFRGAYDDLPLTALEKHLAKKANPLLVLLTYGLISTPIEEQLQAAQIARWNEAKRPPAGRST